MSSANRIEADGFKSHLALVRRPDRCGVQLKRVPGIVAAPGDFVCRTLIAGICGTDLQILRGARNDPARILGHEGLSMVEGVAATADEQWLGTVVAINPTPVSGPAEFGHTIEGMMQQRFLLPARLRSLVVPAPTELSADLAILAEPLASVLTCADILDRLARPVRILAVGRGTIGKLLRIAFPTACTSASEVRVIGTKEGVLIDGGSFDVAILCSSREDALVALRIGVDAVRDGGVLYLFGGIASGYHDAALPGIDLGEIRARHTGGRISRPIAQRCQTNIDGKWILVTGHRGSSNAMLNRAMIDLSIGAKVYGPLLQIMTNPDKAVRALNNAVGYPPIRPWTKLGIDLRSW